MKIYARRCSGNVCETFMNGTITDICQRMITPGMMGYRYMSKIKPKLKCPVKANTYNVDEVDMFFGVLLEMPLEGFRWIVRASLVGKTVTEKNRWMTVGCVLLNARVMASTSHKHLTKPKDVILT